METSTHSRPRVNGRSRGTGDRRRRAGAAPARGSHEARRTPRLGASAGAGAVELPPLRIATLDEDSGFLLVLSKRLDRLGWEHRALTPAVPMKRLAAMPIDVLVIDTAVLGARSWNWLERLFHASPAFRVVICTGSSTVTERVRGLKMGADDWLTKPCHTEELVARIESIVGHRRSEEPADLQPITVGEVEIRGDHYQAYIRGRSIGLTRREFELIDLLAGAGNEPVEREAIYERLWGYSMLRADRSVDVFVHKLRRKLAAASPAWSYIHTHWGLGYRFAAEPVEDSESAPPDGAQDLLERAEIPARVEVALAQLAA